MKIIWITLLIEVYVLSSLSVYATSEEAPESDKRRSCNFTFISQGISTHYGSKEICANIFTESLSWEKAQARCTLVFGQLTQRFYFNSSLHLELLDKGIHLLWIGIHRRANFFITEYPAKLFREADDFSPEYWGYHWSEDGPGLDDCVVIDITTGSLRTWYCHARLPFVCDDDGRLKSAMTEDLICPEGWMLSFPLSTADRTCISQHKAYPYFDAEGMCHKYGGHLASLQDYITIHSNEPFLRSDLLRKESFWIQETDWQQKETCKTVFYSSSDRREIVSKNCSTNFPFICIKFYKREHIKVKMSPSTIQSVAADSPTATDLLTCNFETNKDGVNAYGEVLIQWYKDDIPLPLNSYAIRISFLGDALKRDPYTCDIATRQGIYHCEVRFTGSAKTYSSRKSKFIYTDVATFVIDIQNIKNIKRFDYSHEDFTEYMDDFHNSMMSTTLEKLQYSRVEWDFSSISHQYGMSTMKLLVYVYQTEVDDFDALTACAEIKNVFEEKQSIPAFFHQPIPAVLGNASFNVNCGDASNTRGFYRLMKNLKLRLEDMEETQSEILKKLENLKLIRNADMSPNEKRFDFYISIILRAAEELKRLKKILVSSSGEDNNWDKTFDERERNIFEILFPPLKNSWYKTAIEISRIFGFVSSNTQSPFSRSRGIISEKNKKYINFPNEDSEDIEEPEEPVAERIYLENEP